METNKPNIFYINRSEIDERFDPKMLLYKQKTQSFAFETFRLKDLIIKNPQYGAGEAGIERTSVNQSRYIRITDINEYGLIDKIEELGVTAENIEDKYILNNNDILFARSGATVGKAYIHYKNLFPYECFFAGYMIRFVVDNNKILPDYLFTYTQLNVYKEWVNAIQRTAGQPNINADEYKSLLIPLPPKEIQQIIVDNTNHAYQLKQDKEKEAKRLLDSIDGYLLGELGINLPEIDNSLENRVFISSFREVTGNRLDPKPYDSRTKELIEAIRKSKYAKATLKSMVIQSVAGDWGIDEDEEVNEILEYKKCLVIRATEFDNDFNLKLDNSRVKYRQIKESKLLSMDIQENDLLIEKSGGSPDQPVGRVAFLSKDILENDVAYSNFIHKIRINNNIANPQYVYYFLKTMHNIKLTEAMQSQTNGIRNLIMSSYLNQTIVLPKNQKEIAEHISEIREEAKRLQLEAKEILKKAKLEVEQMILGE